MRQATNPALAQIHLKQAQDRARKREESFEADLFEIDNDRVRLIVNGMLVVKEVVLKEDCTAIDIKNSFNEVLSKIHHSRQAMAEELIRSLR